MADVAQGYGRANLNAWIDVQQAVYPVALHEVRETA
jgi:hypothetical protein